MYARRFCPIKMEFLRVSLSCFFVVALSFAFPDLLSFHHVDKEICITTKFEVLVEIKELMIDLHHPNVVAFYGVVLDGPGGSVATVTEYMVNGSLRTALLKNEK